MACKALIFDLDGTIWDSLPCYGAALDSVSKHHDCNSASRLRQGENIMSLAREMGVGKDELCRRCKENISRFNLYPGVAEGLEQLRKKSISLGIATNLPQWFVQPFLQHF